MDEIRTAISIRFWGESVSKLMITKTVTRNCTQYSFTCVFLTFVHVVFKFVSCVLLLVLSFVACDCCWLAVCIVVVVLYMCCYLMCICCTFLFFTLDAGLLARSQYSEGPATDHLDTGFSWFPCV